MKTLSFLHQKALSTQFSEEQIKTFDVFFEQLGSTINISNSVEVLLGAETPELQERIFDTEDSKHRFNFQLLEVSYVKNEVKYSDTYGDRLYRYTNKEGEEFVEESKYQCENKHGGSYRDYEKVTEQFVGIELPSDYFTRLREPTGTMTIDEWLEKIQKQSNF